MSKTKKILLGLGVVGLCTAFSGCVSLGSPFMIRSAKTPEGWPEPTPIGEVQLKTYPAYREAVVDGDGTGPMFRELFDHIKSNDISMTAPVDMSYGEGTMESMSFLYREPSMGETGTQGVVRVVDREPQTFASVGVRGRYSEENYREGLRIVQAWVAASDKWEAAGRPRFLGYNGPFVPPFMRYGEVQVPIKPRG